VSGLGRKVFIAGDVLEAAEVNGYLMDQTIMVFSDAAARTTAIPTPTQGMFAYLLDSSTLFTYDGSSWLTFEAGGGGEGGFSNTFLLMGA
jgi:hypothetical protein